MSPKDVHIALKRDDCVDYLMHRFDFSNREDLFESIRKIIPVGSAEIIRKLEKRQKKLNKKNTPATAESEMDIATSKEECSSETSTEEVSEMEKAVEISEVAVHIAPSCNLDILRSQEEELSLESYRLESQHKELVARRKQLLDSLADVKKSLERLKATLVEQEQKATIFYDEYIKCATYMESITEECKVYRELLENVRAQIAELQKTTILVYSDHVEVENATQELPHISDEDLSARFTDLICDSEAGELTLNELKTIAKLCILVDFFKASNYSFELIFDNTKVQVFWEKTFI